MDKDLPFLSIKLFEILEEKRGFSHIVLPICTYSEIVWGHTKNLLPNYK